MNTHPQTNRAYNLLHKGILALARAERQGIRVDVDYIEKQKSRLTSRIERMEENFKNTKFFRHWQHSSKSTVNINSNAQLSAFLYKIKKLTPEKTTESGQGSTDEEALKRLGIPELDDLLAIRKLKKVRDTYLDSFAREQVRGIIHPFFNLHLVRTYRSCVAKGTKVLVVRNFISDPKGIPIEQVKKGDYVYCFDDKLKLAISKVVWAGKTGHKEVIRVHYTERSGGGSGWVDVTPEHRIRLIDGTYEQAQNLMGDFRKVGEDLHLPKIRTLSCKRVEDTLRFTGHLRYGIDLKRNWANQFGKFEPGNHIITKIEWIKKKVDVYDIEVEKYHNFFANEICVHNSSDSPNFQNIPKRDEEAMRICRKAIIPSEGNQLLEVDFGQLEVRISACYNKDPILIKDVSDPHSDMHRDMAIKIFKLRKFDKEIPAHYTMRQAAKNGFVFPQFYGDYYKNNVQNVCEWIKLSKGVWQSGMGIEMPEGTIADHLISKGISSYEKFTDHIKTVEDYFWKERYKVYAKWKETWYAEYKKNGYIDLYTGFRCSGVMSYNDCTNYPVQGAAFHCLLHLLIELDKFIIKNDLNSRIIGQIHDSIVLDCDPEEVKMIMNIVNEIIHELPKVWDWIIVPLEVDAEICDINKPWSEKHKYSLT